MVLVYMVLEVEREGPSLVHYAHMFSRRSRQQRYRNFIVAAGCSISGCVTTDRCLIRVKNGSRSLAAGCLLCPGERTSSDCLGMSEKCHRTKPLAR